MKEDDVDWTTLSLLGALCGALCILASLPKEDAKEALEPIAEIDYFNDQAPREL